jgi:DnaK suppressor protein
MSNTLPSGYVPSENEEYMNPNQLAWFRNKLLEWKEELQKGSDSVIESLRGAEWKEPDPNDRATHEEEGFVELHEAEREMKLLHKIDEALDRIDTGDFGYCEESGDPIGLKRLMARPIATLTIEAQEWHEAHGEQEL